MIIATLSTVAKVWKQPKFCMDGWIDKEDVVYIYNGILLSHEKNETLPFETTWVDFDSVILSEISQVTKNQILYDFTHV